MLSLLNRLNRLRASLLLLASLSCYSGNLYVAHCEVEQLTASLTIPMWTATMNLEEVCKAKRHRTHSGTASIFVESRESKFKKGIPRFLLGWCHVISCWSWCADCVANGFLLLSPCNAFVAVWAGCLPTFWRFLRFQRFPHVCWVVYMIWDARHWEKDHHLYIIYLYFILEDTFKPQCAPLCALGTPCQFYENPESMRTTSAGAKSSVAQRWHAAAIQKLFQILAGVRWTSRPKRLAACRVAWSPYSLVAFKEPEYFCKNLAAGDDAENQWPPWSTLEEWMLRSVFLCSSSQTFRQRRKGSQRRWWMPCELQVLPSPLQSRLFVVHFTLCSKCPMLQHLADMSFCSNMLLNSCQRDVFICYDIFRSPLFSMFLRCKMSIFVLFLSVSLLSFFRETGSFMPIWRI